MTRSLCPFLRPPVLAPSLALVLALAAPVGAQPDLAPSSLAQPVVAPAAAETAEATAEAVPSTRRTERGGQMRPLGPHMGEMLVEMEMPKDAAAEAGVDAGGGSAEHAVTETLRFEPWEMLDEMFARDDVVYLMRHGPTDWSKLDAKDVAPTDCEGQRVMSPEGRRRMREMGTLLAANEVLPSRIVVSEWCRNQQTLDALLAGFDAVDPALRAAIPVETDPDLNLLLALQGAPDVEALRARIAAWDGSPDRKGPLLLITHFTNIEELTTFAVYEGEVLVLDPKRGGRVLGYLRLMSAGPDVGHFEAAVDPDQPG